MYNSEKYLSFSHAKKMLNQWQLSTPQTGPGVPYKNSYCIDELLITLLTNPLKYLNLVFLFTGYHNMPFYEKFITQKNPGYFYH